MALSLQDPLVQSYILYSTILAFKLITLSTLTGMKRFTRQVFANPEDAAVFNSKVNFGDSEVERIRRAHLNDVENIPPFWVLAAFYLTTNPVASWATLLFRVFTIFRITHTIVYAIKPLPQPARIISFVIPHLINQYMGVQIILYYLSAY